MSQLSREAENVMLFPTFDLAEAIANHLRLSGVIGDPTITHKSRGIAPGRVDYMTLKQAKHPVILASPPIRIQMAKSKKRGGKPHNFRRAKIIADMDDRQALDGGASTP